MARMTRSESQKVTRQRLLEAAHELFRRDGYAATSVDRISEMAGYSKGAFYSNFAGKEAIFLEVLASQGNDGLGKLLPALADAPDIGSAIDLLAEWADARSTSGNWSLTILEHARVSAKDSESMHRQIQIIRGHWRQLGEALVKRFPEFDTDPEALGALLHEIAYAPAITFMDSPRAGELMRLALRPLLPRVR